MTASKKSKMSTMIMWALFWAIAMIGSAIIFKGSAVKDWVQSALFIASLTFWLFQSQRAARCP